MISADQPTPEARSARPVPSGARNEHRWVVGLTAVLGAYYVLLGVDALPGVAGFVGIAGGLAVLGALRIAPRSQLLGSGLLVAGALAFAIVTWWSVVTPTIAILLLTIGPAALRNRGSNGQRRRPFRLAAAARAGAAGG